MAAQTLVSWAGRYMLLTEAVGRRFLATIIGIVKRIILKIIILIKVFPGSWPVVTSYDYNAPISESGAYTDKLCR